MSTYLREKALRVPMDKLFAGVDWYVNQAWDCDEYMSDLSCYLEDNFSGLYDCCTEGKFQIAPTEKLFMDFLLEHEYDFSEEFGRTRALYDSERERFLQVFQQLNPAFTLEDMRAVRVVEFCWYNCTEAPSYYDDLEDDFAKEITYDFESEGT